MTKSPSADPDRPVRLTSVPREWTADLIIQALAEENIQAVTSGEGTASFRSLAPGEVHILVHEADVPRALEVLKHFNAQVLETDDSA